MSIIYDPSDFLKRSAPKKKIKKAMTKSASLKRAALAFVNAFTFVDSESITRVALNTVASYKARLGKLEGDALKAAKLAIIANPKLLIQRVQNEVLTQVSGEIKNKYAGEFYTWLPSSAGEADPEHQLNYGKKFQIGVGEQPGDRYGCQCGMEILVNEEELNLT